MTAIIIAPSTTLVMSSKFPKNDLGLLLCNTRLSIPGDTLMHEVMLARKIQTTLVSHVNVGYKCGLYLKWLCLHAILIIMWFMAPTCTCTC